MDEGDGLLHFSQGVYRISETLNVDLDRHGYLAITGEEGLARLIMTGAGPALRLIGTHQGTADPPSVKPPVWQRQRMPVIRGIEIIGQHPEADGIELVHTMQTTIEHVLIRNVRHGVHLVERNRNFLLHDSHIYDNRGVGVFFDRCNMHQAIISDNHISYNRLAGIQSLGGDLHNLQITGNDIEYNYEDGVAGAADIWFDAREGMASEITITSNTIQARPSPEGTNLRIFGSTTAELGTARLITIASNVLGSQATSIEMRHVNRVAISGNTIYDGQVMGIDCQRCAQVAISGNTFGWPRGPQREMTDSIRLTECTEVNITGMVLREARHGDASGGGAITMIDTEDCAVSGCQIHDPHWRGVHLENCRRCRISDNSILDSHQGGRMLEAIAVTGESRDNLVQNNLIRSGREDPLNVVEGQAAVQGNVVVR